MGDVRSILAGRIRDSRVRLSLTQGELAKHAGLASAQIVSQIESGEREVKARELFDLARALRMDFSDLLSEEEPAATASVFWRKDPPANRRALLEADFVHHCHDYASLEKVCGLNIKSQLPIPRRDPMSMTFSQAGEFADEVRDRLGLGSRPASCLSGILEERFGVKIWHQRLGDEGSAASARNGFGMAILINADEPPWRRNYSLAHELFHLLTWEQAVPVRKTRFPARIEKLSEAFASSLLLPAKDVLEAFKNAPGGDEMRYLALIQIAREFDVSTVALLWRLRTLGQLKQSEVTETVDDPKFKYIDRSFRMGDWAYPPELPERFVRLGFMALQQGRISSSRLADLLRTSLADLNARLQEYGLDGSQDYQAAVRTLRR